LKFDNDTIHKVKVLVQYHDERPATEERALRHCISKIGAEAMPDLFALKRGDTLGQSDYRRQEKLETIATWERMYQQIIERGDPLTIRDLAVNGKDLMDLGVERGPKLGETLQGLLQHVLDQPKDNTREVLLELVKGE